MATLRRLLQQLSRLAHVNVDHLGAHTGFLRPAGCDEFITADHLSGSSSMWRTNLNSIGPRGISPRCCKHGGIELHLDVAICQWSALLRQFRDGSPIASLRRWSRSYCGANGLMKRSSTRAATACADLQRLGISRRHRAGNWSGHSASAGRSRRQLIVWPTVQHNSHAPAFSRQDLARHRSSGPACCRSHPPAECGLGAGRTPHPAREMHRPAAPSNSARERKSDVPGLALAHL